MSGDRYKISDQNGIYFLTLTVIDWVDIFTRKEYRYVITGSLKYCTEKKGLILYAWCLMSNHLHIIAQAKPGYKISDILRDFKKFTSKEIIKLIIENPESRKDWLLNKYSFAGKYLKRITNYKLWKDSNHAKLLNDVNITKQKLEYIHNNPVKAEIVVEPHEYIYSSAKLYADDKSSFSSEFVTRID